MPTNATMIATDGAWTLQSLNTAPEGRYSMGSLLGQANVQSSAIVPMTTWRSGVIPTSSYGATVYDLLVAAQASPNLTLQVYRGPCVINRSGQGPYLCYNTSVKQVAVDAGDATNPRRDLVVARVYDTAIGDSQTAFTIEVVPGTPAPSPSDPPVPTGAIPLARISVGANASSITNANITDLRTSTGVAGAVRTLLGGDPTSTTGGDGYRYGELRYRKAAGNLPDLLDIYGTDGVWHTLNDKMVCAVVLSSDFSQSVSDVFAQTGWSAIEDPYGMAVLSGSVGTPSYIQVPIDGRYLLSFNVSINVAAGAGAACTIAVGAANVSNSVARDSKPSFTGGSDGTWLHAHRELNLSAGQKIYWATWSSVNSTVPGATLGVKPRMYVRRLPN